MKPLQNRFVSESYVFLEVCINCVDPSYIFKTIASKPQCSQFCCSHWKLTTHWHDSASPREILRLGPVWTHTSLIKKRINVERVSEAASVLECDSLGGKPHFTTYLRIVDVTGGPGYLGDRCLVYCWKSNKYFLIVWVVRSILIIFILTIKKDH